MLCRFGETRQTVSGERFVDGIYASIDNGPVALLHRKMGKCDTVIQHRTKRGTVCDRVTPKPFIFILCGLPLLSLRLVLFLFVLIKMSLYWGWLSRATEYPSGFGRRLFATRIFHFQYIGTLNDSVRRLPFQMNVFHVHSMLLFSRVSPSSSSSSSHFFCFFFLFLSSPNNAH